MVTALRYSARTERSLFHETHAVPECMSSRAVCASIIYIIVGIRMSSCRAEWLGDEQIHGSCEYVYWVVLLTSTSQAHEFLFLRNFLSNNHCKVQRKHTGYLDFIWCRVGLDLSPHFCTTHIPFLSVYICVYGKFLGTQVELPSLG
jgi:hypothetical protein